MSYSVSDVASDSTTVTVTAASTSASPSQGITITSVANDIVYAILVVLDSIAQAITKLAPYLMSFIVTFSALRYAYNVSTPVVRRFFGRYFRI